MTSKPTPRPEDGVVFTPAALASLLARRLLHWSRDRLSTPITVLDPAVGPGALLRAIGAEIEVPATLVGIDTDPQLLEHARSELCFDKHTVELIHGDGLSRIDRPVELVIANPPFLPEKGHRDLFREIASRSATWGERVIARVDLQYLFLHHILDVLVDGGCFAVLMTAYWPTATGASALRNDLTRRANILEIVDLGPMRPFPVGGHHQTLWIVGRKERPQASLRAWKAQTQLELDEVEAHLLKDVGSPRITRVEGSLKQGDAPWHLMVTAELAELLAWMDEGGVPLRDEAWDRQGVVSGRDRLAGAGVFVLSATERERLGDHGVPLLRGSTVEPFESLGKFRPGPWLLYLDGTEPPDDVVLEHLRRFRSVLEKRREVQLGRRPWWALQWPRDAGAMFGPKLVCARRARHAAFALDRLGHAVSSDCTFIVMREGGRPLDELHGLLNSSWVDLQLHHRGKRKGPLIELYAEPLRRVRLPRTRLSEGGEGVGQTRDAEILEELSVDMPPRLARLLWKHHELRWKKRC